MKIWAYFCKICVGIRIGYQPSPALQCLPSSSMQQRIIRYQHAERLRPVQSQIGPTKNSTSEDDGYQFTYRGNDGRLKATFEQAFKNGTPALDGTLASAPWELGYQMSEKNLQWNYNLKTRFIARIAADKLEITNEEVEMRLDNLQALLPDITSRLPIMHPMTLTRLLDTVDTLPQQLMSLKTAFPGANVSKLAVRAPELVLTMDGELMQIIADQLHELLPNLNVDLLVEENPSMLDVEELRSAMAEAKRIMPDLDIKKAMGSDPQLILSFQRGSQLIPYDPPTPEYESEADDDEYAAYYK
jgi:hypothetical protein